MAQSLLKRCHLFQNRLPQLTPAMGLIASDQNEQFSEMLAGYDCPAIKPVKTVFEALPSNLDTKNGYFTHTKLPGRSLWRQKSCLFMTISKVSLFLSSLFVYFL